MVMCWRSGHQSLVDDGLISLNEKPAAAPFIVRFEMAITPAEFRRLTHIFCQELSESGSKRCRPRVSKPRDNVGRSLSRMRGRVLWLHSSCLLLTSRLR